MTRAVFGLLAAVSLAVSGCESSPPPAQFDADQVLRLVAPNDVDTLDPAKIHQPSVGLSLARNVFGGLYRFRDDLVEEPDLAAGMPDISSDGLTWTFHLRRDAHFSNGSPVRADDVLYSWNRVARLSEEAYPGASIFGLVQGYADVQSGRARTLSGLKASDPYTVVATLAARAGYWLVELGLLPTAVVDSRVITAQGEEAWWTTPDGLVGTGPFRMTSRVNGKSLDFEPVASWWSGSTGRLKRIHVEVITNKAVAESRYGAGEFDILGYTPDGYDTQVSDETISIFRADSHLVGQLRIRPWLITALIGFRREGQLATDADVEMRRALSMALDRNRLASICFGGTKQQCAPATGGLITKGLAGYLGDGGDPKSKHDLATAQSLLRAWDPASSRRTVRIGVPFDDFLPLAREVKAEWESALGLHVQLDFGEPKTIRDKASKGAFDVWVSGNFADYNSPHNWLTNVDNPCHVGVVNPQFQSLVASGDIKQPVASLGDYTKAVQLLADGAACPALVYKQAVQLVKPWVRGGGGNTLYENQWTGISILKH